MDKYYVLCLTESQSEVQVPDGHWFAWEDGHYVTKSTFRRAAATHDPIEAARMFDYAKKEGPAHIVTVRVLATPVDLDGKIHEKLVRMAQDKLTDLEMDALRKEYFNV